MLVRGATEGAGAGAAPESRPQHVLRSHVLIHEHLVLVPRRPGGRGRAAAPAAGSARAVLAVGGGLVCRAELAQA
jgi:hypothetical protein